MFPWWLMRKGLVGMVMTLLAWSAAAAQDGRGLGPKDGAGLPPTAPARVAVGNQAPDFALASKDGSTVTLSQFHGHKNIVLVFYRGHW